MSAKDFPLAVGVLQEPVDHHATLPPEEGHEHEMMRKTGKADTTRHKQQ
jgi:hypothetical protein